MKSPLYKLFNYINLCLFPKINVYAVSKDKLIPKEYAILVFEPYYVKEYIWVYKEKKHYYAFLKLINSTYMYLDGRLKQDNTSFNFYIGSDKEDVLKCMKSHIKTWYLEDTTDISY